MTQTTSMHLITEESCKHYYDLAIFHPESSTEHPKLKEEIIIDIHVHLKMVDPAFEKVDFDTLMVEIHALNIELYGISWLMYHYLNATSQLLSIPDSFIPREIVFVKKHLQDSNRAHVWKAMQAYNEACGKTIRQELYLNIFHFSEKTEESEKWQAKAFAESFGKNMSDLECLQRLLFRQALIPYDVAMMTSLFQQLSLTLLERIKYVPNQAGLFAVQRIIAGLYKHAEYYCDVVGSWGSYEAAEKARIQTVEMLQNWLKNRKT